MCQLPVLRTFKAATETIPAACDASGDAGGDPVDAGGDVIASRLIKDLILVCGFESWIMVGRPGHRSCLLENYK